MLMSFSSLSYFSSFGKQTSDKSGIKGDGLDTAGKTSMIYGLHVKLMINK